MGGSIADAMKYSLLYKLAGVAAIVGGLARIFASFSLVTDPVSTEWLYDAIDMLFLFGIVGVYLDRAEALGFMGLAGFGVAVAALSFIGGPDANPFGFNTYEQGAAALAIGVAGLSIAWLRVGERPIIAPLCWIGSLAAAGLLGMLPAPLPNYGFIVAGVLFAAGFICAGLSLVRRP